MLVTPTTSTPVQDNISLILSLVFHLASTHLGRDTHRQIHWSVEGPHGSETPTIMVPKMDDTITVRDRSRGRGGQLVTYYHHFKNEIFIVVYNQVIVELNNYFTGRSTQLLRYISCLDPRNSFASYDKAQLIQLAKIYSADFSQYDVLILRYQLDIFIVDVRGNSDFANCKDLHNLAIKMVQTERHLVFALVYRLIELALILSVATAMIERAFSAMKIIRTELRNKMGNDWLNHRMVCYIERDICACIQSDDILYHFQELKSSMKKNYLQKDQVVYFCAHL
jgi:hypothetical protein